MNAGRFTVQESAGWYDIKNGLCGGCEPSIDCQLSLDNDIHHAERISKECTVGRVSCTVLRRRWTWWLPEEISLLRHLSPESKPPRGDIASEILHKIWLMR